MPKKKNNDTKDRLLERVLPIFLINSYERVTISFIEKAVRTNRGTIYRYFDSKEDLFLQAVRRFYKSRCNVLFALDPGDSGLEDYWRLKMQQRTCAYEYLNGYGISLSPYSISHFIAVQASILFPDFRNTVREQNDLNMEYWGKVIANTPGFTAGNGLPGMTAGQVYHGLYLHSCSGCLPRQIELPFIHI